jgi:hypothetical protein
MATGAAGPTPPEPSRPLSARERAALARLEAETRREDPEWCDVLEREVPPPRRPGSRIRDVVIQVVAVVVLAVLLLPSAWLAGLLVVVVLAGPAGVALWAMRRGVL